MSTLKFAETHNLVAFLEKPKESTRFEEIIDFLNASSVQYALSVNPTIYTTCIEQFWTSAKVKTVNGERQIQALVDKQKVIIFETSIRSELKLDDADGTDCLPTTTIFAELERIGAKTTSWNEFSSTMASAIICLATNQNSTFPRFFWKVTPLLSTMMVQATKDMGEDSTAPSDSHSTPIILNHHHPNLKRKSQGENKGKTVVLQSMSLMRLILQEKVLNLEKSKTAQAKEIASLKKRVKQLEKRRNLRTPGLKRLRKIGSTSRVESSNDASLGAQDDASKQERKIVDLDDDAEVTLVDETQEMNDDNLMFDTGVLEEQEKDVAKKEVSNADPVTTTGEVVTTTNVEVTTVNAPTTTIDELTLAWTLIEIKAAKPKSSSQLPQVKDKDKGIMVEPEVPLKKKDQIALDEEMARNLEAQLKAEHIKEERLSRLKEEKANIALLESCDNTQAMMDANFQLAQQMQTKEQE
ncbi:hypothetical protein Tco_1318664 [Tanacetum coccineum]